MYERMLDKQSEPSPAEMAVYCGQNEERFSRLNDWLIATFHTQPKVVFPYGNHYGWGIGHYKKKKLVCNIFPENGAFTVMVRLANGQFAQVYSEVSEHTRKCIDERYPCGDGGWLHYRVTDREQYEDIVKLLEVKCRKSARN